jgi:hypothetical protein
MAPRDVATTKDLIYYQYAKLIERSTLDAPHGTAAKIGRPSANLKTSYLLRDDLCNARNTVPYFLSCWRA